MATNVGMVAGLHNHNKFVMIYHDGDTPAASLRSCYMVRGCMLLSVDLGCCDASGYERKEGNQCCPQCKTRSKRHKEARGDMKGIGSNGEDMQICTLIQIVEQVLFAPSTSEEPILTPWPLMRVLDDMENAIAQFEVSIE